MDKGFLNAMFDLSFSSFITPKLIKFIYIISIGLLALFGLGIIISGFSQGFGPGLAALILAPIIFLLYLMAVRIWLEMTIVVFRISQNVAKIAEAKRLHVED